MKRRAPAEEHENSERYLITYADLITLLLGLFIILYVSAEQNTKKFKAMSSAMERVFGGEKKVEGPSGAGAGDQEGKGAGLAGLADRLRKELSGRGAEVRVTERGVVIALQDELFFDSGSASFRPAARQILSEVAAAVRGVSNPVRIEGHADNQPIATSRYPSNWYLSSARAVETADLLIHEGAVPIDRVYVAGYGDTRPVASNLTAGGRGRNRRVEVVLLRSEADLVPAPAPALAAAPAHGEEG